MSLPKIIIVSLIYCMSVFFVWADPDAMFTVYVIDEASTAVSNAEVHAGFVQSIQPGWGWGGGKEEIWRGVSDSNGMCVVRHECQGKAGIAVGKEGYYWSSGYQLRFTNVVGSIKVQWQPWNPTLEVLIKAIKQPVPLYAKSIPDADIPIKNAPAGYDLLQGDWTAPYGRGTTADFLIQYVSQPEGSVETRDGPVITYDYSLSVQFSNEGDGIQSITIPVRGGCSALRLPRQAPENGYEPVMTSRVYRGVDMESHSDIREDQNYFFRVRTTKDEKGEVVSALYGKIHGDFQFDHLGKLTFTYYLNPVPNDRNLEFDPMKNLFTNLSPSEEVREP